MLSTCIREGLVFGGLSFFPLSLPRAVGFIPETWLTHTRTRLLLVTMSEGELPVGVGGKAIHDRYMEGDSKWILKDT